jgi:hypothetical protein
LTLPAACSGASKVCLRIAREFAAERIQWGSNIGKHEAIAHKVAFIASHTFAQEAMSFYSAALVDRGGADIRLEAAMCKMFCSEVTWKIINETLQIRSGRGYETAQSLRARGEKGVPVERFVRDARINLIFEGTSEIMRLFIAREALDPHLSLAGDLLNPKAPPGKRLAAALRAGLHYAGWYPGLWNPIPQSFQVHRKLAPHLAFASKAARKLARRLFHAMNRYQASLEKRQALLGRFVEIGTELFAIAATCSRADSLAAAGGASAGGAIELADHFCWEARRRIEENFVAARKQHDRAAYQLGQTATAGQLAWLEQGAAQFPFR